MPLEMNPEIRAQWCAALRSGEYQQARDTLRTSSGDAYCCLGVLTDLYVKAGNKERVITGDDEDAYTDYVWDDDLLSERVRKWAGLAECNPLLIEGSTVDGHAATLNDNGTTFREIAQLIDGTDPAPPELPGQQALTGGAS